MTKGLARLGYNVDPRGVRTMRKVAYRTDLLATDEHVNQAMVEIRAAARLKCARGGTEMWIEIDTPKRVSYLVRTFFELLVGAVIGFYADTLVDTLQDTLG